jgi:hydroxyacid-oxoacid transhydrogenase
MVRKGRARWVAKEESSVKQSSSANCSESPHSPDHSLLFCTAFHFSQRNLFRFTACANPGRHLRAAQVLGANTERARPEDAGSILSDRLISLMRDLRIPNGLGELGYTHCDIPALVEGTLPQHRVTKLSPRPASPEDLARLFEESMKIW